MCLPPNVAEAFLKHACPLVPPTHLSLKGPHTPPPTQDEDDSGDEGSMSQMDSSILELERNSMDPRQRRRDGVHDGERIEYTGTTGLGASEENVYRQPQR